MNLVKTESATNRYVGKLLCEAGAGVTFEIDKGGSKELEVEVPEGKSWRIELELKITETDV